MKPFDTTKLLKPLVENIELTDGEWVSASIINFYIPIYFNPDEYFTGINVNTNGNEDYINLYLNYDFERDSIELYIDYVNYSGYDEGYQDFGIEVIDFDEKTEKHLRNLLLPQRDDFLKDMWKELADVPFDDSNSTNDMILEEDWWLFKKGTNRNDIWRFFDSMYSKGVYSLLYDNQNQRLYQRNMYG